MIKSMMKKSQAIMGVLAIASGLAVTATPSVALAAASTPATVAIVEFSSGQLLIQLTGGVNYTGVLTAASGCTSNNQTADTLRAWTSLAQAALLSGKNLRIYYNVCGGTNYVAAVDLIQ